MRPAELINVSYFALLTIVSLMRPSAKMGSRAAVIGAAGFALTVLGATAGEWIAMDAASIVRDWLPVPLMILAYWQTGHLFEKADPKLQAAFERSDKIILKLLRIDLSQWAHTWVGAALELAYALCYPVVPLGLAVLYVTGLRSAADQYWTVLLLSAYPCYALLPLFQLLPPRLIERTEASGEAVGGARSFNLWLVRRITHEANTFPSGHVASSAAIAMVLLRFAPLPGIAFLAVGFSIAVGCIVGRYHYIADVGAALLLAGVVFAVVAL